MYDVNFKNLKKGIFFGALFLGVGLLFFIVIILLLFKMVKDGSFIYDDGMILLFVLIMPLVFMIVGFIDIKKVNKRIKVVKHLNEHGTLVKGIPYHLEETNMTVNDTPVLKPVVNYQLPNGDYIRLEGDPRHDFKERDEDGLVDMLIDEENPKLYFIDLEINRYTGNVSSDYYTENGVVVEASVPQSELNQ